jgi:hypothetical protein
MTDAISSSETAFFARGFLGGSGSFGIGVDCLTAGVAVSSGGATVVVGDAAPAGAGDPAGCARPAEMANVTSTAAKSCGFQQKTHDFSEPAPRVSNSRASGMVPSSPISVGHSPVSRLQ